MGCVKLCLMFTFCGLCGVWFDEGCDLFVWFCYAVVVVISIAECCFWFVRAGWKCCIIGCCWLVVCFEFCV